MRRFFSQLLLAMAFACAPGVAAAATIDQYGNVHKETWDYMGEAYERSKSFSSTPSTPDIVGKINKAAEEYYRARYAAPPESARERENRLANEAYWRKRAEERERQLYQESLREEAEERKRQQEAYERALDEADRKSRASFDMKVRRGDFTECMLAVAEMISGIPPPGIRKALPQPKNLWFAAEKLRHLEDGQLPEWMPMWSLATASLFSPDESLAGGYVILDQDYKKFDSAGKSAFALSGLTYLLMAQRHTNRLTQAEQKFIASVVAGAVKDAPSVVRIQGLRAEQLNPHLTFSSGLRTDLIQSRDDSDVNLLKWFVARWWLDKPSDALTSRPSTPPVTVDKTLLFNLLQIALCNSPAGLAQDLRRLRPKPEGFPSWFSSSNSIAMFRRFAELRIASFQSQTNQADAYAIELARRELKATLMPYTDEYYRQNALLPAGQSLNEFHTPEYKHLMAWQKAAAEYTNAPFLMSPRIIADAAEGSPEAFQLLDDACNRIGFIDLDGNQAKMLAEVVKDHPEVFVKPGARCQAAWAVTFEQKGKALTGKDAELVRDLIKLTPSEEQQDGAIVPLMKVLAFGFGEFEAAEKAGQTWLDASQKGGGKISLRRLVVADLTVSIRMMRWDWRELSNLELMRRCMSEIAAVAVAAKENKYVLPLQCDPAANLPQLLERYRQLGGDYAVSRTNEVAEFVGLVRDFRSTDHYPRFLADLVKVSRREMLERPWSRQGLDALIAEATRDDAKPEALRALWSFYQESPWWTQYRYVDENDFAEQNLNSFLLRWRAEGLAAGLLWLQKAPESERAELLPKIRKFATAKLLTIEMPAWFLVGRDYELGGIGTRLLLAQLERGEEAMSTDLLTEDEIKTRALAMPAMEHAWPIMNRLVGMITNDNSKPHQSQMAALALSMTAERVIAAEKDSSSKTTRRQALDLIGTHLRRMLTSDNDCIPAGLREHHLAFCEARLKWEQARLADAGKPPAEIAAPIVRNLGPAAFALAYFARCDVAKEDPMSAFNRCLMLEGDRAFSPALLRAAAIAPGGEALIARYLNGDYPRESEDWEKLVQGRSW